MRWCSPTSSFVLKQPFCHGRSCFVLVVVTKRRWCRLAVVCSGGGKVAESPLLPTAASSVRVMDDVPMRGSVDAAAAFATPQQYVPRSGSDAALHREGKSSEPEPSVFRFPPSVADSWPPVQQGGLPYQAAARQYPLGGAATNAGVINRRAGPAFGGSDGWEVGPVAAWQAPSGTGGPYGGLASAVATGSRASVPAADAAWWRSSAGVGSSIASSLGQPLPYAGQVPSTADHQIRLGLIAGPYHHDQVCLVHIHTRGGVGGTSCVLDGSAADGCVLVHDSWPG